MILHNLTGNEAHPSYQKLEVSNGVRHYDFLKSIVDAAVETERPFLSQTVLKALNFHAIACLHPNAGMYRPCPIRVGEKEDFPAHWQLPDLMDDFVNLVNRKWTETHPVLMAAFVLWKLNRIHPFINGNGRTARAACLFILCVSSGGWLPYSPILPQKIRENRDEYVKILQTVDASDEAGALNLQPLIDFLQRLIKEQIDNSALPPEET